MMPLKLGAYYFFSPPPRIIDSASTGPLSVTDSTCTQSMLWVGVVETGAYAAEQTDR